ncbi:hypothetical protein PLESTB_001482800 [Pleodorina starrii]|uniref:ABM domain-containing protein n=1 Tax=Pleodorina starrii TaxID=330485 RepID=A0A9W6BX04_9CHLO|nr:hypothetical protein PLESTB_001482800 [Pleodorina starrii]
MKALEWLMGLGREEMRDRPGFMLVKYDVPPTLHDKFIEKWGRHDKDLRDVRGLDFYQLSKDVTDNTFFWSYTEWDTCSDMIKHWQSKEYQDFHDWVDENDIMCEAFPLEAYGDAKREYRYDREGEAAAAASRAAAAKDADRLRRRGSKGFEDWDPREEPHHIATRFHVMPSMRNEFLDAFDKIQKRVAEDEDENRFFVLRKCATLNHHYLVRGGWDSMDGFMDHMTSKKMINLREFAKDNDIEWYANHFRVLYTSERKE